MASPIGLPKIAGDDSRYNIRRLKIKWDWKCEKYTIIRDSQGREQRLKGGMGLWIENLESVLLFMDSLSRNNNF